MTTAKTTKPQLPTGLYEFLVVDEGESIFSTDSTIKVAKDHAQSEAESDDDGRAYGVYKLVSYFKKDGVREFPVSE